MKSVNIFLALIFSVASFSVNAQKSSTQKESVSVYGNCGMCKTRIEKAAVNAGATSAKWNDESKVLAVSFASSKTSLQDIEKAVAAVGHDTKNFTAPDEVYEKLHGCCKYDRKATEEKTDVATASCCKTHDKCAADKCCDMAKEKVDCCKADAGKDACCSGGKSCCA